MEEEEEQDDDGIKIMDEAGSAGQINLYESEIPENSH